MSKKKLSILTLLLIGICIIVYYSRIKNNPLEYTKIHSTERVAKKEVIPKEALAKKIVIKDLINKEKCS